MHTRIIGDIHGVWYDYHMLIKDQHKTIQLGDFGIGFAGPYWHDRVNDTFANLFGNHRFIRGNHDNPQMCEEMTGWIEDGTVENDIMFIGGAWSIDQWRRTEGVSWWPDEELSYQELNRLVETYAVTQPRVMITHDCPQAVSKRLFVDKGLALGTESIPTRTGQALQAMFEIHQPEQWYFGHWHHTVTETIDGTQFTCLGELDYVDVEL